MNQDRHSLYHILQVDENATDAEIKGSYKRLALKYHPDRNPTVSSHFSEIQYAYSVLSDPNKRKIYDMFGQPGLSVANSSGYEQILSQIVSHSSKIYYLFALSSLFIVLSILQLICLALKIENESTLSWILVLTPLWVLDISFGVFVIGLFRLNRKLVDCLPNDQKKFLTIFSKWFVVHMLLELLILLVFQVLMAIQLQAGHLSWSTVFIPYAVWETINLGKNFVHSWIAYHEHHEYMSGHLFFDIHKWWALRVISLGLVLLKLNGQLESKWTLVLFPVYILFGTNLIVDLIHHSKSMACGADQDRIRDAYRSKLGVYFVYFVFFYSFLVLLNIRLETQRVPSMFIVFMPFWILLGLLLLLCSCILPFFTALLLGRDNLTKYFGHHHQPALLLLQWSRGCV